MAKGDLTDATWAYINQSLDRAKAFGRKTGNNWKGDSNDLVSQLALSIVMCTRNQLPKCVDGKPPLRTDNPKSNALAWADHYLDMRTRAGMVGLFAKPQLLSMIYGYNGVKDYAYEMIDLPTEIPDFSPTPYNMPALLPEWAKAGLLFDRLFNVIPHMLGTNLEYSLREDKANPTSRPSPRSIYWALEGVNDGITDYENNYSIHAGGPSATPSPAGAQVAPRKPRPRPVPIAPLR